MNVNGHRRIFILAGEPSGDALAARLMSGLKEKAPDVEFFGVGGPLMAAEGLESLFPMEELSVMGLFEVLPRLPTLLKRIDQTAAEVKRLNPDIFISVDAPDFSFRVARKLAGSSFPKVHYVAPSVWAWRPGRAKKVAALYDHLLTLLPFEPPYFDAEGLPASFVGHSVIETGADKGNGPAFRERHGIGAEEKLLMLLPGSRRGEATRLLPIFKEAVAQLQADIGAVRLVVPVIGRAGDIVRTETATWEVELLIVDGEVEKFDAMAASDVALAASGTVALELALARLPSVIAYRMNPITAMIARRAVKLDHVNLVNILLKREAVPEHILENCRAENLSRSLAELFQSEEKRAQQIVSYEEAMLQLGEGDAAPGARAADIILKLIARNR
ncbi:lipid-A-disaccharide synthase [Sneathiella sp. CAU 1612]|uniref:Lipid-A-disaccharide synthase n=1 Tax=Sneathiella sedimenti TaxID=2816034 RepID=A0ABS3F903_9PROT|nr:lipid-A-disaccharide synthase [Sneathiella sedimenti]MBO0334995.1 lipid-A-disaccharide synthase [Sneathiella sedimenti]